MRVSIRTVQAERMALIEDLELDEFTIQRSLELYQERLQMLDTRDPVLAIVAQAQISEHQRYRAHF